MKIKKPCPWVDIYFERYFFRKTGDGQNVFYPWGYPGEGVLVGRQKRKILFSIYALLIFIVLWSTLGVLAEEFDIISRRSGAFLYLISCSWWVPLCASAMYFLVRKKEFVIIPEPQRSINWVYAASMLLAISLQTLAVSFSAAYNPPPSLLIVCGLGCILTLHFFIKILRTRGLYFARE